ncbi:hypothetical protein T310_8556 [Rasamsonia emersonii CBS 393.64]|uniref:Uncharacterized protein n=1 Tax=Rasamsonia emersonii (strain ATCC 16479 / CBS 393.64 / IMI 116815) TaxID=1408163 RepID=A0A0F4YHD2_RASE3|nr:hypothetical protein T310_8556 [Rasamsonia emersonii CBS 393.64]KKA17505.1 hypothetical protein T310_8556 [Rasamsonia emersonii CBS 393.64]
MQALWLWKVFVPWLARDPALLKQPRTCWPETRETETPRRRSERRTMLMSLLYLPYSVSVPTPVVSIPTTPFIHSFFLSALSATGAAGRADHVSSRAPIDNASTNRPDRVADRRGAANTVASSL